MNLVVVDYGVGNLGSIPNMLRRLDAPAVVTSDAAVIAAADRIILPGVGAFDAGMASIRSRGLEGAIRRHVDRGAPLLGLCLGMQLLFEKSAEGSAPGLGILPGRVVAFDPLAVGELALPHMGWNTVQLVEPSPIIAASEEQRFYFAHSYHAVCDEPSDIVGMTTYGYGFPSIVQRGVVMGAQFHPEKSHRFGLQFLANFLAV